MHGSQGRDFHKGDNLVVRLLIGICCLTWVSTLRAEEPKTAYEMLPESVQAVVWIPDAEALAERWNRTELARLADDPSIRDFWQDQQQKIEDKLTGAGWRLHIQPRDLEEIVQGQIALAWIEHPQDVRKTFSLALIVDVVDKAAETKKFLEKLDQQLKERGAPILKHNHGGVEIVQHTLPRQNGELLPQETFYAVAKDQLLASDDLPTLKALLDSTSDAGTKNKKSLSADPVFQAVRKELKITGDSQIEYFARPLGFARVLRAMGGKQNSKPDVLAVLQEQGFETINSVCGELKLGEEKFDILHRGYVLANEGERPRTVQVLDFPNQVRREVPLWVSDRVSSMLATCWNVKEAFWKVEGLVNAMAGQDGVFKEIIEGIKVDPTGPQIDIARDVMPLLTNEIYSVSDSKMPIDVDSRRNLIALRLTQPDKMIKVLNQAMATEPDAESVTIKGQQIWQVAHKEDDLALDLDADFGAFGTKPGNAANAEDNQPWLNNWAITVYGDYLMFASHVEMITEAIEQARKIDASKSGAQSPLASQNDYRRIADALVSQFGDDPACTWRINRSELAYRPQYELFRAGKLQESQSMLAHLLEHLLQNKAEIQQKKPTLDGSKLPPFESVSKYLQPSGVTVKTTDKGWEFGSVLLSQAGDQRNERKAADNSTAAGEPAAATKPVQGAATQR